MGDYFQNSEVTTLHNLRNKSIDEIEKELIEFNKLRPIGLIIPCTYNEIVASSFKAIIETIITIPYLSEIIIGLDSANENEFKHALEIFSVLPQNHRVLWNDGPRMKHLEFRLNEENIQIGNPSKGKNLWNCLGYAIASGRSEAIAIHYADITTYNRELLARLVYPVSNPSFNFKFCKSYYFRADERKMNGRMVRLLISPLLQTLKKFVNSVDYLKYLECFRYVLSDEISMRADTIKNLRLQSDFGLEIGILTDVLRNIPINRICQVEIADRYDHKHQSDSFDNPEKGLSKMSYDITRNIYARLASDGCIFNEGMFRSIKTAYQRKALEMLDQYDNDAIMNGFTFNRHKEERLIDQLSKNVYLAGINFLNNPSQPAFMPEWKKVSARIPDVLKEYKLIVEEDNALDFI
jgi:glucosyl-3-phosphoglycerate synthase